MNKNGSGSMRKWAHEQVNSLKNFQQHSRLHFIGQWKTKAHDLFKEWFAAKPEWNHGVLAHQSLFVHLDMDAFFCSVVLAKEENAHLRNKPVCIAAGKYNSDISSSNYVARSFGVCAGMCVNAAKELCPNLQVLNYDLLRCEQVIKCLYRMLFELCPDHVNFAVEVYSIDEVMIAFDTMDYDIVKRYCSDVLQELESTTNCTASCGIGPNIMFARIATKYAKPNGIHFILPQDVPSFVAQLPLNTIHGVGNSTMVKLRPLLRPLVKDVDSGDDNDHILCCHVQKITKQQLQRAFGPKTGENLYNLCRGNDTRLVSRTGDEENRRLLGKNMPASVSCSMNYAVRPVYWDDVWSIARQLLGDVCAKLERGGYTSSGLRVTLLERHPLHPKETQKYLGRGRCVEFHVPISFEYPLKGSELECMFFQVKRALTPLLVLDRQITGEERAHELGLNNDVESRIIWTVSSNTVKNVLISDVRGMTIQATALHYERDTRNRLERSCTVQTPLHLAFLKGSRGKRQSSEFVSNATSAVFGEGTNAFGLSVLEEMIDRDVDEAFVEEWKTVARQVSQDVDYTAMKILLRMAAFRCAASSRLSNMAQSTFRDLVTYANSLLPIPVAFT